MLPILGCLGPNHSSSAAVAVASTRFRASGAVGIWLIARHRCGVHPMNRLNTVVKWACVWNPTVRAISAMGMVVFCNNSSARPIRRLKRNSWGRRLVAIRNWEAKYIGLNLATTAKSERVIFAERLLSTYSTILLRRHFCNAQTCRRIGSIPTGSTAVRTSDRRRRRLTVMASRRRPRNTGRFPARRPGVRKKGS